MPPAAAKGGFKPTKMSEMVARAIVHDIVRRRLEPGTVLGSEKDLLAEYGVSRASFREALRFLEIQGFISTKSGPTGGPVVEMPTSEAFAKTMSLYFFVHGCTLRELMDARLATESMMAGLAASYVKSGHMPTGEPPEAPELLRRSLEHEKGGYGGVHPDRRHDPLDFHRLVARLSYNKVLITSSEAMGDLYTTRMAGLPVPAKIAASVPDAHTVIANAIIAGDAEAATEAMRDHLRSYIDIWSRVCPWVMEEFVDWQ
jgi:DNA-binding FadR family transcriptional regulator